MIFSVVIPSYKTDKSVVKRAIDSVLKQTFKDFELIVVDDNDENQYKRWNRELAHEYKASNVRFAFHECNKGANPARNTGIKSANGEFIAFLDSDDEWDNNYLSIVSDYIIRTNKNIYSSNYRLVTKYGVCTPVFKEDRQISGMIYDHEIFGDLLGPTSTVCVRKATIIDAGMFDISLPARQDYDMWLRICKHNECVFIFDPLILFYKDGGQSISSFSKKYIEGSEKVLTKILKDTDVPIHLHNAIKAAHYKQIAHGCITAHDYRHCRTYIKKSLSQKISFSLLGWYVLSFFPNVFERLRDTRMKYKIATTETNKN